jgi:Tfp pilus assembly protein FimV
MSTMTIAPQVRTVRAVRATKSAQRSQVRLTRRGRLVVFLLAFGLVVAAAVALAAGSAATREQGGATSVDVVTVAPGDTLWDIASDAAAATGGGDVRDMMERIEQLNAIDGSVVYAGQELRVPSTD